MAQPLISICIPCYKKPDFVVRCLQSILKQDYKNIEIILSDDSPDEDTKAAIQPYTGVAIINYYHNHPPLKTPKNWNRALDEAKGELVVLMHQDDWYHRTDALSTYVAAFADPGIDFVFCRNTAINEKSEAFVLQALPRLPYQLSNKPNHLILAQVIGPPSNTMLRGSVDIRYDERLIWFVDVDYYIRMLKAGYRYCYIPEHLVSIGLHKDQTTEYVRSNDHIILKENIIVAGKLKAADFSDIKLYDYYWRLLRNHQVRTLQDITVTGIAPQEIPYSIKRMLAVQSKIRLSMLRNGVVSKTSMALNYLFSRIFM